MLPFRTLPLAALVAVLALPTAAMAIDYPPAGNPG